MHHLRLPDGYIAVPDSKIAAVVTYLEMSRPQAAQTQDAGSAAVFQRLSAQDVERYRTLFSKVGLPWLWFSRLAMSDAELQSVLGDPRVEAYAIQADGTDIGLAELDFRVTGEAEISFFGLVPERLGKGLAGPAFCALIKLAWARPIRRIMVHTCTLDHPAALDFYIRNGFRPYKRAIEIADDPRITGTLAKDAGIRLPMLTTR